jgi:hypothetical protein
MSILAMVIVAAAGVNAVTAGTGGEPVHRVTVCMEKAGIAEIRFATERASEIFAGIGVEIDWHIGPCPSFGEVIRISFSFVTPEALRGDAMAYAHPTKEPAL